MALSLQTTLLPGPYAPQRPAAPTTDSPAADSALIDSADTADTADTIPVGLRNDGVVLTAPRRDLDTPLRADNQTAGSWLILGVLAVVCIVFARYKSNLKYLRSLVHDLTSVRKRENVFDDTAKETSFMAVLNILCAVTLGLNLFSAFTLEGLVSADNFTSAAWTCILAAGVYCLVMPAAYWVTGMIFSTSENTRLWLRGFLASQALMGLLLLLPSMTALFYPDAARALLIVAAVIFVLLKLVFISKTFRIFFAHFSSWVLFLYYLCILEILPPLLTYAAALYFVA